MGGRLRGRLRFAAALLWMPLACGQADQGVAVPREPRTALKAAMDARLRKDYAVAKGGFEALADAKDSKAQFYLGLMNEFGEGVPKNDVEAARWYRLSA